MLVSRRGDAVIRKSLACSMVKLGGLVLAIPLAGQRFGILAATALGVAAALVVVLPSLRQAILPGWSYIREGVREIRLSLTGPALRNYASALMGGLPNWLLPLIVVEQATAGTAAHFYTSWMIVTLVNTGPAALAGGLLAEGARQGQGSHQLLRRAYVYALLMMIPAVLILTLGARQCLGVFSGSYAAGGADLLRYLAVSGIPYAFVQINFNQLRLEGKLFTLIGAAALHNLVVDGGSYFLLPTQGVNAVGISWLLSCVLTAALRHWLVYHYLGPASRDQPRT